MTQENTELLKTTTYGLISHIVKHVNALASNPIADFSGKPPKFMQSALNNRIGVSTITEKNAQQAMGLFNVQRQLFNAFGNNGAERLDWDIHVSNFISNAAQILPKTPHHDYVDDVLNELFEEGVYFGVTQKKLVFA